VQDTRVTGPRPVSALPEGPLRFGEYAPHPRLASHVERYWTLEVLEPPASVRLVPDGLVDLVFELGPKVTAWVAGPRRLPVVYTHARSTVLLGASIRAASAPAVLGVRADALPAEWGPLTAVLGAGADALSEAIAREAALPGRLAVLEVFLAARLAAAAVDQRVARAVSEIVSADGVVELSAIARRAGASPRNLGRLFRSWVGVGPKQFARIVRAQAALQRLADVPPPELGALAAELGFADQAHLSRELRAFTGAQARTLAGRLRGLADALAP